MATIEERLTALEAEVKHLKATRPAQAAAPVNLEADKYANFTVRKSPPNWLDKGGPDYAGTSIADTTPEFCDAVADFLDWQAAKDEAKNYSYVNGKGATVFPAEYARKDAARARAWAKRLRDDATSNQHRQAPRAATGSDDEIPF